MPLSDNAFPYEDPATGQTKVWDNGQAYDIDESGNVIMPNEGPVNPFWTDPNRYGGKYGTPPQSPSVGNYGTTPGYNPTTGAYGGSTPAAPKAANPPFTPTAPPMPGLPSLDIQPGLQQQNWEATYNLTLAQEKRLREIMETVDQPKARSLIDQAIQAMRESVYQNQVRARDTQSKETGLIPGWLPQAPKPAMGAWRDYQIGGLVAPPGTGQPGGMSEDQAAQAIWNNDPTMQQLYTGKDMTPVQAVRDWWSWAPHEGAMSIAEYAQRKGWS